MEKSPTDGFDLETVAKLELDARGQINGFQIVAESFNVTNADKVEFVVEWDEKAQYEPSRKRQAAHTTYEGAKFDALRLVFISKAKNVRLFRRSTYETNHEDFSEERALAMLGLG